MQGYNVLNFLRLGSMVRTAVILDAQVSGGMFKGNLKSIGDGWVGTYGYHGGSFAPEAAAKVFFDSDQVCKAVKKYLHYAAHAVPVNRGSKNDVIVRQCFANDGLKVVVGGVVAVVIVVGYFMIEEIDHIKLGLQQCLTGYRLGKAVFTVAAQYYKGSVFHA